MAVAQQMSEQAYQEFVLSGVEGAWELHDGRLVEKPGRTWEHGCIVSELSYILQLQLSRREFPVFVGLRVRRLPATIFVPDLIVVPIAYGEPFRGQPDTLAIFSDPLPLVVEVWSPWIGEYDVEAKLPVYRERCDLEIWRIHPYKRTVTVWQRQPDGFYQESVHCGGIVSLAALPGVTVNLDELFNA